MGGLRLPRPLPPARRPCRLPRLPPAGAPDPGRCDRTSDILAAHAAELQACGVSRPLRCLELGAGCSGLPSIVAAASPAVGEVVVTDRGEALAPAPPAPGAPGCAG